MQKCVQGKGNRLHFSPITILLESRSRRYQAFPFSQGNLCFASNRRNTAQRDDAISTPVISIQRRRLPCIGEGEVQRNEYCATHTREESEKMRYLTSVRDRHEKKIVEVLGISSYSIYSHNYNFEPRQLTAIMHRHNFSNSSALHCR